MATRNTTAGKAARSNAVELAVSEQGCSITNDTSGVYEQITIECPRADRGPAAALIDEIEGEECALQSSLDEFPIGLTCDPSANPNDDSIAELTQARDLLRTANDLLERVCARERRYSPNNGYSLPGAA